MRTAFKHSLVSTAVSATVLLVAGGLASAHLDPEPLAMEAGSTGTVAFKVEHGCDGSPTTDLKFEIPDGVTGVAPVDKDGWTGTVTGNTVEFKGGPLAPDEEDHFDITMTVPSQAGEIRFPAIQTCEQGELAWIEIPAEGAAEPEHPAPTLKITDGPPSSADLTPEEEAASDAEAPATGDTLAVAAATAASDDPSNTGTIVVVIVAAVVLAGGGVYMVRRKNASSQAEPKA